MALDDLRQELAAIDRQLLELAARRRQLAEAVGASKGSQGLPIRDYGQEKEVLDRARSTARELDLSVDLAADLMRRMIEDALSTQERQRVVERAEGSGRSALVIGGSGRMGGWFARFLASQGFSVEVADPLPPAEQGYRHHTRWQDTALDHELIVVAAPLAATEDILKGLAERKPPGLVFDIGSLKTPLANGLRALEDAGVQYASIHPMFGPGTEMLSERHVIFVDVGSPEATAEVESLFTPTMATRVHMGLEEHDQVVAFVLGLSHALNIAFFSALAESGQEVPRLSGASSTTFDQQLRVAANVADDNPHLYFEIQHLNAFGGAPLEALENAVTQIKEAIASGDETTFVEMMTRGREYLSGRDRAH